MDAAQRTVSTNNYEVISGRALRLLRLQRQYAQHITLGTTRTRAYYTSMRKEVHILGKPPMSRGVIVQKFHERQLE